MQELGTYLKSALKDSVLSKNGGTWLFLLSLASVYSVETFSSENDIRSAFMLCPSLIVGERLQIYRLLTYAFTHETTLHLLTNATALIFVGSRLESRLGTAAFLCVSVLAAILGGLTTTSLLALASIGAAFAADTCVIGFSGVLFTYIYLISVFEEKEWSWRCVKLKSRLVPWALLLLFYLLADNSSTLCHFGGIIIGVLYQKRILAFLLPSAKMIDAFSAWRPIAYLQRKHLYTPQPSNSECEAILSCCSVTDSSAFRLAPSIELPEI